jgi:hypothetical protein
MIAFTCKGFLVFLRQIAADDGISKLIKVDELLLIPLCIVLSDV